MGERVALVGVEEVVRSYDFGPSHPLRPERVLLTFDRLRELGLLDEKVEVIAPRPATDAEITAVHDREFVDAVRGLDSGSLEPGSGFPFGLGTSDNPIFAGMHASSAAVSGASIVGAEAIVEGHSDHAFNPAGGLHHARRREASGFCIYNDPGVAIAKALELEPDWRVMYIDVDVHHGDGVQWIFYDDPRVLTVSLHQSGSYLYPGTGFGDEIGTGSGAGTAANIPFLPYSGEDDYLWALDRTVPALAEAFEPDLLVTQLGADTHHGDPLANLGLTMSAYPRMARILHDAAHRFAGGRWLATGGGGYQFDTVVPKVWTIHFAEMADRTELIPNAWLDDRDPKEVSKSFRADVERSVEEVLSACIPRLQAIRA